MGKIHKVCLIGCGRMGATIDDEVKDRPHSNLWIPYSHAAGHVAVESTELIAVSDVMQEKVEAVQKRYNVANCYTDYREMILGFVESHRQGGARVPLPLENRNLYVGRKDW